MPRVPLYAAEGQAAWALPLIDLGAHRADTGPVTAEFTCSGYLGRSVDCGYFIPCLAPPPPTSIKGRAATLFEASV